MSGLDFVVEKRFCVLCQVEPQAVFLREQVGGPELCLCKRCWDAFLATGRL